jgi:hypothetical protein
MPRSKAPIVSLDEARARFEEWRTSRRGKARIPAELWSAAVEVARKEGINRTARELHVAWDDLKRRMTAAGAVPRQPTFCGAGLLWSREGYVATLGQCEYVRLDPIGSFRKKKSMGVDAQIA